jgi:hypothetical protein
MSAEIIDLFVGQDEWRRLGGVVLRSWVDALWAAFFDAAGVRWVYNSRRRGAAYEPTFFLPDLQLYLDVVDGGEASASDDSVACDIVYSTGRPLAVAYAGPDSFLTLYWCNLGSSEEVNLHVDRVACAWSSTGASFLASLCDGSTPGYETRFREPGLSLVRDWRLKKALAKKNEAAFQQALAAVSSMQKVFA